MLRLTYEQMFGQFGILSEASTLTYDMLFRRSDPKRIWRSGQVRGPPLEIDSYKDAIFHTFNFKSNPSTTGQRHRGYIKFEAPRNGRPMPAEKIPVVVDCNCPDFRYRWAWANKQRGASRVGSQSMNQALDRAPRITNPGNKVGLCKHLLAARHYLYGLIQRFDKNDPAAERKRGTGTQDMAWKLDQLVKLSNKKWTDWEANTSAGKRRSEIQRQVQQARNIAGPMPAAEVPPNIDNEVPAPLPGDLDPEAQRAAAPGRPQQGIPAPIEAPGRPRIQRPGQPPQRGNQNQEESCVVRATANNINVETMNKDLLNRTKALVEALEDDEDQNLAKEVTDATFGGEGEGAGAPGGDPSGELGEPGAGSELPPPPTDEFSDIPPEGGDLGGPGAGAPEDEALGLLQDIAAGIDRLANELAPMEAPEGAEGGEGFEGGDFGGAPADPKAKGKGEDEDDDDKDEPGVPPVEDDDDFSETMPVASGA